MITSWHWGPFCITRLLAFVRRNERSPVSPHLSPHKRPILVIRTVDDILVVSLWTSGWTNIQVTGDLRHREAHVTSRWYILTGRTYLYSMFQSWWLQPCQSPTLRREPSCADSSATSTTSSFLPSMWMRCPIMLQRFVCHMSNGLITSSPSAENRLGFKVSQFTNVALMPTY